MSKEHRAYGWTTAEMNHSHAYLLPAVMERLREFRCTTARLVDLGCGNGYVTRKLHGLGHEVIGVDAAPDGIAIAREAYPELRFEVASVYEDELASIVGTNVDAVISLEVIEHLYAPKKLLEQAYAILRPGGALILSTPYHGYVKNLALALLNGWDKHFSPSWEGGHIKFFSEKTLGAMAREVGFRNIRFEHVGRAPLVWKSMILLAEK
jgi:2-polyprenyl-3-methyl-5-hydroxy-6-metoxy-1,4-benzoquinol methylase